MSDATALAPLSVEEAAHRLIRVREQKADLAMVESELIAYLAKHLPRGGGPVEGVGFLEVKRGRSYKWDGALLVQAVAARSVDHHGVDRETGEIVPPAILAQKVAADLADCAGLERASHGWRKGALKDRKIDPDRYCTSEPGALSVIVR